MSWNVQYPSVSYHLWCRMFSTWERPKIGGNCKSDCHIVPPFDTLDIIPCFLWRDDSLGAAGVVALNAATTGMIHFHCWWRSADPKDSLKLCLLRQKTETRFTADIYPDQYPLGGRWRGASRPFQAWITFCCQLTLELLWFLVDRHDNDRYLKTCCDTSIIYHKFVIIIHWYNLLYRSLSQYAELGSF